VKSRVAPHQGSTKQRLESWKEVADYFGRTDRTVKRWEVDRGLPIHRPPGAAKGRIYAEVDELEVWLKGGAGVGEESVEASAKAAVASPDEPRTPARRWPVVAALLVISTIALITVAWTASRLATRTALPGSSPGRPATLRGGDG
jgi:hypothetical protein